MDGRIGIGTARIKSIAKELSKQLCLQCSNGQHEITSWERRQ